MSDAEGNPPPSSPMRSDAYPIIQKKQGKSEPHPSASPTSKPPKGKSLGPSRHTTPFRLLPSHETIYPSFGKRRTTYNVFAHSLWQPFSHVTHLWTHTRLGVVHRRDTSPLPLQKTRLKFLVREHSGSDKLAKLWLLP